MQRFFGFNQLALLALVWIGLLPGTGCTYRPEQEPPVVELPSETVTDDALRSRLDAVLDDTLAHRRLNLREHAAWQILHGALAYQRSFPVVDEQGQLVSAVDHILGGGLMQGWTVRTVPYANRDTPGLRAILESGTKAGQGHADQWLAILAQCALPADQPILVNGETVTMTDFVFQVQQDVPRNHQREYSWTLIGLTSYLPTDAEWTATDGESWSIERLMEIELEQDLSTSACGGTHRLIGLCMALNRHLATGGALEGVWARADEVIMQAARQARELQNPDGSFSIHYFQRPGRTADLAQDLGATGHVLEFLALALPEPELREPWLQRSVVHMCELFEKSRDLGLECGALYHAAHGLALYRERVFGPRDYALPQ